MNLFDIPLSRRRFLALAGISTGSLILGCAVNPVTGKQQLMLVSEGEEKQIDRVNSPHQFSADYGPIQDKKLSTYISGVGSSVGAVTHRPDLPYRYIPLNAAYVNAYTFPAGSIGITRGILLELNSEAALAALIGHELGHVNSRHTAQAMSKGVLTSLAIAGLSSAAADLGSGAEQLAGGLGQIAAGALLASYSRENEREADALALKYMVKAGYSPQGHLDLMDMLRSLNNQKPSAIELMFATHPMSQERYDQSLKTIGTMDSSRMNLPLYRERYMDNTASLRAIAPAIEQMEMGDQLMKGGMFSKAKDHYGDALRKAPGDYAAFLMMAKCQLALKDYSLAQRYAEDGTEVYPGEPQALHLLGMSELLLKRYDSAHERFLAYKKKLPGNPNTVFYIGLSAEGMEKQEEAANRYNSYLKAVNKGEKAQYAYSKLKEWGYIK
ncbi:MAG: M48 family metalloprotease [bacterium]|nr:M48 family metalloprotease [bacterium]